MITQNLVNHIKQGQTFRHGEHKKSRKTISNHIIRYIFRIISLDIRQQTQLQQINITINDGRCVSELTRRKILNFHVLSVM